MQLLLYVALPEQSTITSGSQRSREGYIVSSTKEGARARRNRTRAAITTAAAAFTLAAIPAAASAAFVEPPQMPHAPTVFPDRDFVSAEGYGGDKAMRVTVLRNGVKIGEAFGNTDKDGLIEVNHPGGVCWSGSTPNIIAGDKVVIAEASAPATDGDAVTTSNVTADAAIKELDAFGQPTGRVIVKGRALNADGTAMDLSLVEQRVVNADLKDTAVNKRDVRAVLGEGLSADPSMGVGGFIAVYDQYPDDIDDLIVNGQTRVLTWQDVNAAGDRLGITIHEVGEVGGPGFGGCPGGSDYAVTGSNHPAVTKAMNDTNASLVVSGVAKDATAVDVTLTDGSGAAQTVPATVDVPAPALQTWTAEFTAAQLAGLRDGSLTASATYMVAGTPIGGVSRSIPKDTVAPGAPLATPGSGTYTSTQAVTLLGPDPTAKIHFVVGAAQAPTAASPVAPAQISVTSSQTIRALAVDAVGNISPVSTFDYVINPGGAAPSIDQVIPGPSQAILPARASSLAVSRLTLARRISISRLRAQGLRTSMQVKEGTNVVRIAIYKARGGHRSGRALFTTTRTPRSAGLFRVTLRSSKLSQLKPGQYMVQVRAGGSAITLSAVRQAAFTVTR
jgi:hypothetical protein